MIYFCIPALNEARTIGVLLWKIRQVMEEFPRDYQILVLDDGSTDDTRAVLEPYLRVLPVSVLRNERTQGYAPALERLIREAANRSTHPKRDIVVTLQADFTEDPADIPLLLKRLEGGADVVGTVLTDPEGELPRSHRWARRGLPWLLSRARLPREIRDPLSGFRAYRVAVLRRALQDRSGPLLTRQGWAANAELLMAVAPHVRRAEDAEVRLRFARRERATRFHAWGTAVELWNLARRAPRAAPLAAAGAASQPPAAVTAPEARPAYAAPAPGPAEGAPASGPAAGDGGRGRGAGRDEGRRQRRERGAGERAARDGRTGEGGRGHPGEQRSGGQRQRHRPAAGEPQREPRGPVEPAAPAAAPEAQPAVAAGQQPLAEAPLAVPGAALSGDEVAAPPPADGDGQRSGRRRRSSRGRRRGKAAAAAPAAAGEEPGGAASEAPAAENAPGADAGVAPEGATAAPRRRSRPRRPRRSPGPNAAPAGGEPQE